MEPITQLADILQELSGVSSPSDAANYRFAQWHVDAVKASAGALAGDDRFWQRLAGRGVSMLSVAKSLGASMRDATAGKNMLSIPFFAFLLNLPGCPVRLHCTAPAQPRLA